MKHHCAQRGCTFDVADVEVAAIVETVEVQPARPAVTETREVRAAVLADDGVTVVSPAETATVEVEPARPAVTEPRVVQPARVEAGPVPEYCPGCGHPFIEHPDPASL